MATGDRTRDRRLLLMSSAIGMTPLIRRLLPTFAGRRMAFIPTASYAEPYGAGSRMMRWWWRAIGFDVRVVDPSDADAATVRDELMRADLFYVCGGNSFHLMHWLRASPAARIIRARVARGIPYLGESAGAVVAGPDIDYIEAMDARRAQDAPARTIGLGLTGYHVVPHVGGLMLGAPAARILTEHASDRSYVGLRNDQALVVTGERSRVTTNLALAPLVM